MSILRDALTISRTTWLLALFLIANPADSQPSPPTAVDPFLGIEAKSITPVIVLDLRFSSSKADRERWLIITAWATNKSKQRSAEVSSQVAKRGLRLLAFGDGCYGDELCEIIIRSNLVGDQISSQRELDTAYHLARIAADGFMLAIQEASSASQAIEPRGSLAYQLLPRYISDQVLRRAASEQIPNLSDLGKKLFQLIIGLETSKSDHRNTLFLRNLVSKSGWPAAATDREETETAAWLIFIHSRHDPDFRLAMLDSMAAAVKSKTMTFARYATRVDHILSETAGFQRYGTKGECRKGAFVLTPLVDNKGLDALRESVGLPSVEHQAKMMADACMTPPQ